jgi:hypothetical protein
MKLKPWIHSALHIGCVALLLWQGHHIQQLRKEAVEKSAHEMSVNQRLLDTQLALTSVQLWLNQICSHSVADCGMK